MLIVNVVNSLGHCKFSMFIRALDGLCHMPWRNLNIETEKSEQTVFVQISLS